MTHSLILIDNKQVLLNRKLITPEASLKLRNYSPDGFAWGYAGSGPAQLALAILQSLYGSEFAMQYYQNFKDSVIAKAKEGPGQIKFKVTDEYKFIIERAE